MEDVSSGLALLPATFGIGRCRDVGLTDKVVRRLVDRGTLVRLRRGVYGRPGATADTSYLLRVRAAAESFGDAYAVSHLSAAAWLGLPMPLGERGAVHLTKLRPCHRSRQGVGVVVHHADSSPTPVTTSNGLTLTDIDRTLIDCLRTMPPTHAVPIVDAALHQGLTSTAQVRTYLTTQRRWVGVPRARASLELSDGRRETWLESFSFVRLHQVGVPLPTPQVVVFDSWDQQIARVDGIWTETMTVGEADGRGKYLGMAGEAVDPGQVARTVIAEKKREDDLRSLGLTMVRWDLDDLLHQMAQLVRRIASAQAMSDPRRFAGRIRISPRP